MYCGVVQKFEQQFSRQLSHLGEALDDKITLLDYRIRVMEAEQRQVNQAIANSTETPST